MSLLDQHRGQLERARNKRTSLDREAQTISRRLNEKRSRVAKGTSESMRKSRQREVDGIETSLVRARAKVVAQDKVITDLQNKIAREEAAEQKKQTRSDAERDRNQTLRDRAVDQDIDTLRRTTAELHNRLTAVESASLESLALAVADDPVQREHDVFLSFATPDEAVAAQLRDELQGRGLDVWMSDAKVALGESLVTGIDRGIGDSRCGICFVTPAYVDPDRFWPRQELAALIMGRKRVIPVVAGLEFTDVQDFSALLGDRKGLSTAAHGLDEIAELIVDSLGNQ